MAELHLARDVLDKILRDRNGREIGRVDGVIIELRPGFPPNATEIECGLFTALRRVNGRLAAWLERLASLTPIPLRAVRFPLERFEHEGHFIELPIDSEADPHWMRAEKWLRTHIVDKIPGGTAPKPK